MKNDIEPYRKLLQKLIIDRLIFWYFKVYSKNEEGIESFSNCLKFDIYLSLKLDIQDKNQQKKLNIYSINILIKFIKY